MPPARATVRTVVGLKQQVEAGLVTQRRDRMWDVMACAVLPRGR